MKRICIHTCLLLNIVWLFLACRKERDLSYQGATVVEFSNPITGTNSKVMGPTIGGGTLLGDNPSIPIKGDRDSVLIQLVGAQRTTPIRINYEVIAGTAVEGVDFEIVGERGHVTIEPNQSAAAIYMRLMNAEINPTAIKTVQFRIVDTDQTDIKPSANYSSFSVSIFPMKVFLNKSLSPNTAYLSLADGIAYAQPEGNAVAVDFAYIAGETAQLASPAGRSTLFSQRLFAPAENVPTYLQASYVSLQLNNASSTTINAIPESGTASNAVTATSVAIVTNGVYAFKTTEGKKGYIRIKELVVGGTLLMDIMYQP